MPDLAEHQRKAGSTKTAKKTAASRENIARARDAIPLRKRYIAALEEAFDAWMSTCSERKATAIKTVINLRGEMPNKRIEKGEEG